MHKILIPVVCLIFLPFETVSYAEGNLASRATRLADMQIDSAELRLSVNEFEAETGKYYRWRIVHDGGEEFQIVAPDLFRNSWIDQVVINDLEVQPFGLYAIEFDDGPTQVVAPITLTGGDGSVSPEVANLARSVGATEVTIDTEPVDELVVTVVVGRDFDQVGPAASS